MSYHRTFPKKSGEPSCNKLHEHTITAGMHLKRRIQMFYKKMYYIKLLTTVAYGLMRTISPFRSIIKLTLHNHAKQY